MGLRCIKGLSEREGARIAAAGNSMGSHISPADPEPGAAGPESRSAAAAQAGAPADAALAEFVRRAELNEKQLAALAEVGALESFGPSRREALWAVRGLSRETPAPLAPEREQAPRFRALTPFEQIGWDYKRAAHSASGHLLLPLREALRAQRLPDARAVAAMRNGQRIRYAGLVICRQHPGTAAGVTFMTLEDETGFVNAVLWKQVFAQHEVLVRTASFLGITGKLQIEAGVVHLIAESLWAPQLREMPLALQSRDFH